jgi:hypothetical protein
MSSRLLLLTASVVDLLFASPSLAHGLMLQQFSDKGVPQGAFVRIPHRADPQGSNPGPNGSLAADFAEIADTDDPSPRRSLRTPPAEVEADCRSSPYHPNPTLSAKAEMRRVTWYRTMIEAACEAGVPANLFDALITQESRYDPAALSPKGATGLAQLMPASAHRLGVVNVWDPQANLRGGARLLRKLLDEFGRYDLALAAYNAGAGRVRPTGQVPMIPETVRYVSAILVSMRNQMSQKWN